MRKAFLKVKRNKGKAGIDGVSIRMFEQNLNENLAALMKDIKTGNYNPCPLKRVYIPKTGGGQRPPGIPIVRDRIAQEVIREIINPMFASHFHHNSFGFIEGKNCHQAVEAALSLHKQGFKFVVDADISKFFDNIPHDIIMNALTEKIADGNILRTIERFLKAGVMEQGIRKPTNIGTPQGGVISPLLANIVLNKMDWFLDKLGYQFIRYADDFIILTKSRHQAEEALTKISAFINNNLRLKLNQEKTNISSFHKRYSFLGFNIRHTGCSMRQKSVENLKNKIRNITVRHLNLDKNVITSINRVLIGTVNYFVTNFSKCKTQLRKIDYWIRMRIRCMKFKRKSYRDNYRLTNKHIRNLGLIAMTELADSRLS